MTRVMHDKMIADPVPTDPLLSVRTSPVHGRGLYCQTDMKKQARIGAFPVLILSRDDSASIKSTRLFHYVFHVDDDAQGRPRYAVAFGAISMCNHSPDANADFRVDADAEQVILTARRAIRAGEEIYIDYGDFADTALDAPPPR